jgi:hypothetical protein
MPDDSSAIESAHLHFPMPVMANLPAGKHAHRPTDLPDCPVILLGNSNFTLCLIKDIIVRYEEGEKLDMKFKTMHGGHQEYETK